MSSVRHRVDVGWELRCEDCHRKRVAAWWPLTSEYWNEHNMARCRACNLERKRAREKTYRRPYMVRYRVEARSAIAIKNRLYYESNRERLNAYNREYREANRARILEQQRARYARQKRAA